MYKQEEARQTILYTQEKLGLYLMTSKVSSAVRILREEGPVALCKESTLFLAEKVNGDGHLSYRWSVKEVEKRKNEDGLEDILHTVLDIEPGYSPYKISATHFGKSLKLLPLLWRKSRRKLC